MIYFREEDQKLVSLLIGVFCVKSRERVETMFLCSVKVFLNCGRGYFWRLV